jgi:hypothetical protein
MREDKNKVESIPARSGESRPRSSRSREAFRQRQKELAESRAQERRQQEGKAQADREKDNKAQTDQEKDNKAQEGWEAGDRETRNPDVQGNSPLPKILSWKAGAMVLLMAGIVLMGVYVYKALGYRNTYFPHTVINGMDVSGKTVEDVKGLMASGVNGYGLVLRLRGEEHEIITGDEIGLHTVFDGSLEEIIRQQNPFRWPRYLLKGPSYDIRTMIAYDDDALGQTLEGLSCFDSSRAVPPSDAYLSDYVRGQGYSIVPETEGTTLDMGKVREQAEQAISSLAPELDLDALGCYKAPSIRSDNSSLAAARDARNRYVNMTVTYTFGSKTEVLDGDEIHQWLVADGEQVSIDPDQAAAYVKSLGTRYNTAYTKRSFATSYGQSVEVSGFYGWRINQSQETKELLGILETGENVTREPVYLQTAASHDGPDYGGTYAEVNLTAQHLIFYKDGEKVLESDFVSGNVSRGHTTPPGIFSITYKQRDAVLKGEGYASPVKFWMPFNGGIGFHDASWRSSFGGSIYKSGGSHGCVNMPYDKAKELFDNVYAGMPVICYDLPGTESRKSSQSSGRAPQETAAAQPVPAQTAPAPTQAPPVQNPDIPEGTLPSQAVPPETAPQPSQPQVIIQPADQTTVAPAEPQPSPGTTEGYGPAFQTPQSGSSAGPGVS